MLPADTVRTTVHVPADLMERMRVVAAERGVSIATVIRSAIDRAVNDYRPPPNGGFL